MQYIIGIDIGTTHTKAIQVTTAGNVLQDEKAGYPTLQPSPGYSEQDPDEIFRAVQYVLNIVLQKIPDKHNIAGISFSSAMHGIMAIDFQARPLTAMLTWADTRSTTYAAVLKKTKQAQEIAAETGTPIHPMSPLCKIAWIKNELPSIFEQTFKFISVKEYIFYQLFGVFVVDYSIASATGLFDIHQLSWNSKAMQFAGISLDHLSRPVSPLHRETALKESFKDQFGFTTSVPFVIGSSDGCLAILGSGVTRPDEAALTIGTSAAVRKINDQPINDLHGRLFNYLLMEKWYVSGGASNNGGNVLKWFSESLLDQPFASEQAFQAFIQSAFNAPAGSGGLVFLPYIHGERAPVWDAEAKGIYIGISSTQTKHHFMRAVLEGICFSLSQVVKALEENGTTVDTIYASGGFIQSDKWVQMLSDILNKRVVISHAADASAMGAVFMALYALGLIKEWNEVKNMVVTSAVFQPDQNASRSYLHNYRIFENLYDTWKDSKISISHTAE
ncbi:MAG: gluconokinase [Chitinophagaceae bacterium]